MTPLISLSRYTRWAQAACGCVLVFVLNWANAQPFNVLPAEVETALQKARVPKESMAAWIQEVGNPEPVLSWRSTQAINPASVMKLLTTYAALDLLGPAWVWSTPVRVQGAMAPDSHGALNGNVVIKGQGDPKLVMERLWLLMRRIRQLGIQEIRGDMIVDRGLFSVPNSNPAEFDGEALRPYNASPDALLLNFKSIILTFTPDPAKNVAMVSLDPPLATFQIEPSVPLATGPCNDWRGSLKADFTQPHRLILGGAYPASCGEKIWPVAYTDPQTYNQRALQGMWQSLGGRLLGRVRDGTAPSSPPTFEISSPSLNEVVRDINKFSNNVMAQQLFLTLGLTQRGLGSLENSREVLRQWVQKRLGDPPRELVIDNGSGLSRENRVTAEWLGKLLQSAWASPVMPELMSSLPVGGMDGTLRRFKTNAGRTHLKTGSLKDVAAIAGYVLHPNGRRYILVAIINHPEANSARPAIEALIDWSLGLSAVQKRAN